MKSNNLIFINIIIALFVFQKVITIKVPKDIIQDANAVQNPLIPVAAGIGGEVIVACSECKKMLSRFILTCVDQESNGNNPTTFRGFCEANRNNNLFNINTDLCLILNAKLASVSGESGDELVDPTKAPALCIKYKNECDKLGGAPDCFSGFCEKVAECIDCPTALIDKQKNGNFEVEVCGLSGVCRLGWKNPRAKGGNGYCECNGGMKGIACNEY